MLQPPFYFHNFSLFCCLPWAIQCPPPGTTSSHHQWKVEVAVQAQAARPLSFLGLASPWHFPAPPQTVDLLYPRLSRSVFLYPLPRVSSGFESPREHKVETLKIKQNLEINSFLMYNYFYKIPKNILGCNCYAIVLHFPLISMYFELPLPLFFSSLLTKFPIKQATFQSMVIPQLLYKRMCIKK